MSKSPSLDEIMTEDNARPEKETYQGYPVEDIEEGQWLMESPLTGNKYIVTKRVDKGDGNYVSLKKELVDDDE